jgi:hypothetical protein
MGDNETYIDKLNLCFNIAQKMNDSKHLLDESKWLKQIDIIQVTHNAFKFRVLDWKVLLKDMVKQKGLDRTGLLDGFIHPKWKM